MSEEEYNAIWRKIKEHGTTSNVSEKAWEMFQASFNMTMKENFLPDRKNDQLKPQLCTDDDKMLRHHQALRNIAPDEEDGICRQHHPRDNRKGSTIHAVCFAASGVPLHIAFQKSDVGLFDTVVGLFEKLFNAPGPNNPPDLTNWATLNADRAYMRISLLAWWLKCGGDILGTVMKQDWLPYTTGDSSSSDNDGPSSSRQKNIPAKQYPTVHQSTLRHNLGKKTGEKGSHLTTTVYSSGISSAAVMTLHSTDHKQHFDCVSGSSSELKECLEVETDYDNLMRGFSKIVGKDDPFSDYLHDAVESQQSQRPQYMSSCDSSDESSSRPSGPQSVECSGIGGLGGALLT
eukprot:scaffold29521_cov94-Skeletonema_dohrnii-CCMP3373.AAC.1